MSPSIGYQKKVPDAAECPEKHLSFYYKDHEEDEFHEVFFKRFEYMHGLYKPQHRSEKEQVYFQYILPKKDSNVKYEPLNDIKDAQCLDQLNGIIVFAHGYTDHSSHNLKRHGIEDLCHKHGYAYLAIDHIGHGLSYGTRAYVPDVEVLAKDLLCWVKNKVKTDFAHANKDLPVILIGESMGGLISLQALREDTKLFSGVALCAPLVKIADNAMPSSIAQSIGLLLAKLPYVKSIALFPPQKGLAFSDPKHEELYAADSLTYSGNLRLGTGSAFLQGTQQLLMEDLKKISSTIPSIVFHGTADRLVSIEGSRKLIEAGFENVFYEGMAHGLFAENCQEQLLRDIKSFVLKCAKKE